MATKVKCSECNKPALHWYGEVQQCDFCGHTEATRHFVPAGVALPKVRRTKLAPDKGQAGRSE